MINFRMLKMSDYTLWICLGLLILIGTFMVLSSTFSMQARAGEDPFLYLKKHVFALLLGLLAMALFMYLDFDNLKTAAIPLYVFILLVLGFVYIHGFTVLGAQRWISFGPISFQPSEISKLIIIIVLSYYLESRIGKINNLLPLIPIGILVGIPFLMIFRQPDLGTSLVVAAISLGMLVWAKTPPALLLFLFTPIASIFFAKHLMIWFVYLLILGCIMLSVKLHLMDTLIIMAANIVSSYIFPLVLMSLKEYQRLRLLAFINPNIDPRGAGYHSLQAKIAVGSGRFFGKGLFHGTQTQLQFIPQQFSDFIFSAVGEELGFLGSMLVLILFIIIIWRAITIAVESRTVFGSLLAAGIAVMLMVHLLVNIGMTLGLLPVVGIPLPFMSYGGTSLLVNLSAIGILQSISMRRSKLIF